MSTCESRLSFFSLFSFRLLSFSAFSSSVFSFFRNWNIFSDYLIPFSFKFNTYHHLCREVISLLVTSKINFSFFFTFLTHCFISEFLDYYFISIFELDGSCHFLNVGKIRKPAKTFVRHFAVNGKSV